MRCPSTVLAASMIKEVEDVLNMGTMPALDAFVSLRTKCLLHYFGLIGRSLNLKVSSYSSWIVKQPSYDVDTRERNVESLPLSSSLLWLHFVMKASCRLCSKKSDCRGLFLFSLFSSFFFDVISSHGFVAM